MHILGQAHYAIGPALRFPWQLNFPAFRLSDVDVQRRFQPRSFLGRQLQLNQ